MTDFTAEQAMPTTNAAPRRRRRIRWNVIGDHTVLILGSLFMTLPLVMLILSTTLEDATLATNGLQFAIDDQLVDNFNKAMFEAKGFTVCKPVC